MSRGNKKLPETTIIFNLPAGPISEGGSCPNCQDCYASCYARKAERIYPATRSCREENMRASKCPDFVTAVVGRLTNLIAKARIPVRAVRIHESGDFYSLEYAQKWAEIARALPGIQFYGYTKVPENLPTDIPDNLNIVHSILPDGETNYGEPGQALYLAAKYDAPVCPATKYLHTHVVCGETCTKCFKYKYVIFYKH